jgi:hypothetical protein
MIDPLHPLPNNAEAVFFTGKGLSALTRPSFSATRSTEYTTYCLMGNTKITHDLAERVHLFDTAFARLPMQRVRSGSRRTS